MSKSTHAALTSSKNPNWRTPDWLFDALHVEFDFALDASATVNDTKCGLWLGPGSPLGIEDALCGVSWREILKDAGYPRGAIFDNPPYNSKAPIDPWIEMMAREGELGTTVGIIPYSPQTRWWREFVEGETYTATEIRRFPARIKFDPPIEPYHDERGNLVEYNGSAPGANINNVVVIYKPTEEYLGRWAPLVRYWWPNGAPKIRTRKAGDEENGDEER